MRKNFNIQTLRMNQGDDKGVKTTTKTEAKKPGFFERIANWFKKTFGSKATRNTKPKENTNQYNPGGQSDEIQADITRVDGKTTTTEKPKNAQQTIASEIANEARRKSLQFNDEAQKQAMDGEGNSVHKQTEPVSIIKSGTPPPPPPPPMPNFNAKSQPGAWRINKPEQATTTDESKNQTAARSATPKPEGMSMADMLKGDKKPVKQIEEKTPDQIAASQKASMERAAALKLKRAASEENINNNKKTEPISKSASAGDLNKNTEKNTEIETNLPSFKERQAAMIEKFKPTATKTEQAAKDQENRKNSKMEIK